MADSKLSSLSLCSVPALTDLIYLVDVSDTTDGPGGSSRRLTVERELGLLAHVCQGRLSLSTGISVYRPWPLAPVSTDTSADTVTFPVPHGYVTGTLATVATTGGGLTAFTTYYLNAASSTAVSFHTTLADAESGSSKVDLTSNITVSVFPLGVQSTTLRFVPHRGDLISIYDATRWKLYNFTERTLSLGTVVPYQAYDVFIYDNSGTLTLEALEWANATVTMTIASPCVVTWTAHGMKSGDSITFTTSGALPTGVSVNTQYFVNRVDADTFNLATTRANRAAGTYINTSGSQSGTHTGHHPQARATALTTQDGVYVKSGATSRRYLGSFVAVTTAATEISRGGIVSQTGGRLFVANAYNRYPHMMAVRDATDSWTYTTVSTWRTVNGAAGNMVEAISPLGEDAVFASANAMATNSANACTFMPGVGINVPTFSFAPYQTGQAPSSGTAAAGYCAMNHQIPMGYNAIIWLEQQVPATGTTTWYGDAGYAYGAFQTGLMAIMDA